MKARRLLAVLIAASFVRGLMSSTGAAVPASSLPWSHGPQNQVLPQGVTKAASIEGITQYNLANGLRVLIMPDESKPTTTVNITYLVGSRNENYGETGMAHLLEHLMFKGTPNHPHPSDEMTAHGSAGGGTLESSSGLSNGTTWFDRTNYYETFPASESNLEWALGFEADRMINSFISKKDLDSEMTVVRNELESDENDPLRVLEDRVRSAAYEWHNYSKDTLGARSDLENVPITRIQAFYKKYYQPDNAVLIIAGKFNPSKALSTIANSFGYIPKPSRVIEPSYTVEPPQDGEREVTVRRTVDTQAVTVGYHIPAGSQADTAAVKIISRILMDSPSGRLFKLLTPKGALIKSNVMFEHDPGMALFTAQVTRQTPVEQIRSSMIDTIEGMVTTPPSPEEVDRARAVELNLLTEQFQSTTAICIGLSEWIAVGDWRLFFVYRDQLKNLKQSDVARVARYYFKQSNRTVATLIATDKPDRAEIPASPDAGVLANAYKGAGSAVHEGEIFDPTPEKIKSRLIMGSLKSGLKFALLPKTTRGATVAATITLNFGDASSLKDRTIAGILAQVLLSRGTTTRTAQQIADELNKLNAQITPTISGSSAAGLSIRTTRDSFPKALALAADLLQHPAFPPDEFQRFKALVGTALASQQSQPDFVTGLAVAKALTSYEPGDPRYAMSLEEIIAAFKSVTLQEVKDFHDRFYGASDGQLVVVGDFDPDETKKQAETLLGDWKSPQPFVRLSQTYKSVSGLTRSFETPDKPGASFVAATVLDVSQRDADYPALVLANFIIGGGFLNSRMEKRIRGKEGLAYTVYTSLTADPDTKGALFRVVASCAPENISKVETAAKEEITQILKEGFSADETEAGKKGYLEAQKVNFANDSMLAGYLSGDLYLGRTIEWDAELNKKIAEVTPDQMVTALRRTLNPSNLCVFKAGDFAKSAAK